MFTTLFFTLILQQASTGLFSLTNDGATLDEPLVRDEAVLRYSTGDASSRLYLDGFQWGAVLGDLDGDLYLERPTDIDALAYRPRRLGKRSADISDLLFSFLSNEGPYLDGDILQLVEGQGIEVIITEAELVGALQLTSGAFDIDALAIDPQGGYLLSASSDHQTGALGWLEDGAVWRFDPVGSSVSLLYSEAQVQTMVDSALGGTGPFGDLLSLAHTPDTGELVFTVQSPSSADATLIGVDHGGHELDGWRENDFGFASAAEIDAFTFAPASAPPHVAVDLRIAPAGQQVRFTVRHMTPGATSFGLVALNPAFVEAPGLGAGYVFATPDDPAVQWILDHAGPREAVADVHGQAYLEWTTPTRASLLGSTFYAQGWDGATGYYSQPVSVRVE